MHENAPSRFTLMNGTMSEYFVGKAPRSFVGKSNHDSSFMARVTFILSNSSTVTAMLKAIKDVLRIRCVFELNNGLHVKTIAIDRTSIDAKL